MIKLYFVVAEDVAELTADQDQDRDRDRDPAALAACADLKSKSSKKPNKDSFIQLTYSKIASLSWWAQHQQYLHYIYIISDTASLFNIIFGLIL